MQADTNNEQKEQLRPTLADWMGEKFNCHPDYARLIIRGHKVPSKGKGLAILNEVQRIYQEPITRPEWEK